MLVYPKAEAHPPPLPAGEPVGSTAQALRVSTSGEFDGVRAYQRGDPMKAVVWKKAAKTDELVSRDTMQHQQTELWLDLQTCGGAGGSGGLEAKLSRLCAWVLAAERAGLRYGLRLNGQQVAPGQGEAHKLRCLEALALC